MQEGKSYRPNVAAVILSSKYPDKCEFFIAHRSDIKNAWQFPQGGIDNGETPLKAAKRELFEEVGISSSSVKFIGTTKNWIKYDIPLNQRKKHFIKKKIKGQTQKWFMLKLTKKVEISFINDPDNEFDEYKWVSYWYPLFIIVSFKKEVYRSILSEMRQIYCNEIAK